MAGTGTLQGASQPSWASRPGNLALVSRTLSLQNTHPLLYPIQGPTAVNPSLCLNSDSCLLLRMSTDNPSFLLSQTVVEHTLETRSGLHDHDSMTRECGGSRGGVDVHDAHDVHYTIQTPRSVHTELTSYLDWILRTAYCVPTLLTSAYVGTCTAYSNVGTASMWPDEGRGGEQDRQAGRQATLAHVFRL